MSAHTHTTRVEGCFRCELSADEAEYGNWRALADALTAALDLDQSGDDYLLDTSNIKEIARDAVEWLEDHGCRIVGTFPLPKCDWCGGTGTFMVNGETYECRYDECFAERNSRAMTPNSD